jgi:hypothetical protein
LSNSSENSKLIGTSSAKKGTDNIQSSKENSHTNITPEVGRSRSEVRRTQKTLELSLCDLKLCRDPKLSTEVSLEEVLVSVFLTEHLNPSPEDSCDELSNSRHIPRHSESQVSEKREEGTGKKASPESEKKTMRGKPIRCNLDNKVEKENDKDRAKLMVTSDIGKDEVDGTRSRGQTIGLFS